MKKIILPPHEAHLMWLSRTGEYRYHIVGGDPYLGFTGEQEGQFSVVPGQTREYKNRIAGHHLVIQILYFNSSRPYSATKYFGGAGVIGQIQHGNGGDSFNVSAPGVDIQGNMNWPLIRWGSQLINFIKGGE